MFEQLIKKILDFWKEFDGESINSTELRKTFTHYEIATILHDDSFRDSYYKIVSDFQDKIYKLDGLFTQKEAEELVEISPNPVDFFDYLSDEKLLSFVSNDDYNKTRYIANILTSDESKIKGFNMVKDSSLKAAFISNLDSDELKLKYLRRVSLDNRSWVISTLKDENLMEKYITFFTPNKGDIIRKFSSDDKKIYYLKKFFRVLTSEDKATIISSLKNDEQILYFLNFCNDKVKVDVVRYVHNRSDEFMDRIIQTIKNKNQLAELLKYNIISDHLVIKYIDQITNIKDFIEIVSGLESKYKIKYLDKFNDSQKIELINDIYDSELKFKALSYINNKEVLFELIEHCERFPNYSDDFEYIIDLYSNKYNLSKERLLFVVKNISLSILKVIENPNIMKILKTSQENFMKVMRILDKEQLKMDSSAMNDILNTLLQREFRIKTPEIILVFPNMLNAIENKDKVFLLKKLSEISQNFDINSEISQNNWSLLQFVDLLLNKNETAICCLHIICTKFIRYKRNKYIQDNIQTALEKSTINKYDKNDLLKYMIYNYPVELIVSFFPCIRNVEKSKKFTVEEQIFLKNRDLIKEILLYKKNPSNYQQIPQNVKINMKLFNSVFEKSVANRTIEAFPDVNINKKICEFKTIDSEFLVNIMMYLDMDRMEKSLFNNQELLDKLMKFWKQYKIGGWENNFNDLLTKAGIIVDAEIIANFIQYFGLSYESLQEKIEKGELANISLTALLDLAACYSSESKKYSMVFGAENFKYIASNPGPNASTMLKEKRIEKAVQLLKTIRTRDYVTVPPVDQNFTLKNGKKMNIVVGNFSNIINLTYGERTGACMRIGGAGQSLFNFCLEDENGFHIRFSNPDTGDFVSRVSGFRNGNTVFLNQLRYSEDLNYTNKDVVEACKLIADELIRLSKNSSFPIENVVITSDYSMRESSMQEKNLGISDSQLGMKKFYTDVSLNSIVLSTSNQNNELVAPKLGVKGVPKYPVKRDKQKILYNSECQEYVAHLKSLDQVLSGCAVDDVDIEVDQNLIVCFAGEDWCVTIDKDGNLNDYIMSNTNSKQQAIDEVQSALMYLKQNLDKEITISNNISLGM